MFWMASASGANAVLRILVLIVLTRLLTPVDFGVVSAALIVIGFSAVFSQLGLAPALVQRRDLEPVHIQTAFVSSAVFGLAFAGLIWLLAPQIAAFFHMRDSADVLRTLAWLFPLRGVSSVAESLAQRDLGFSWLAKRDVLSYALGYGVVGIGLAWAGWGVWALVAAQLAQGVLDAGLLLARYPPSWRIAPSGRAFRELLDFGAGFTLARVASFLANQGDNIVVGRVMGPAPLGIYTRAYQIMAAPTSLLGDVLDRVLFPTMARVQGDRQRLATAYLQAVASIALVMLPVGVVMTVLAPEFVTVLLGPRWGAVVAPFQVFAIALLFRTSYRMSDSLARATGAVYRRAWRQAVYAALVFLAAWVGSRWSVAGVAVGVLASLTVNFFLMAHLSLGVSGLTWRGFAAAHLPAMLCATVAGTLALVSVTLLRESGAPAGVRLLGAAAVTGAGFGVALWRIPRPLLGPHGLHVVGLLRGMLPGGVSQLLRSQA
jgi:O-antigen/teichoic acid export membrane protein